MKTIEKCICSKEISAHGLCEECLMLLKVKKCKSIALIEKIRANYNKTHSQYKTYGQFVAMVEEISRRKKNFDNRRKKANTTKIRTN